MKKLTTITGIALAIIVTGIVLYNNSKTCDTIPPLKKESAQDTPIPSDNIIVTICALKDHSFEVALQLLKESDFEKRTGIVVNAILLEFEPMLQAHELELSSKKGFYDIVSIDQPSLGYYFTQGWVQPLNPFMENPAFPSLDLDDVVSVLKKSGGEWNNTQYAIPLGSYGSLFTYRSDVLQAAGLKPPKTFKEFRDHARKINTPPTMYGTALFAHLGEYITADAAPFLWSWGAGLINGSDVTIPGLPKYRVAWDTPQGLAALEFYASLYTEGLTPSNTLNFDHARYIGAFQSGKVAMGIMPAEGIGAPMEDPAVSKVIGKIAYANLPGKQQPDGSIGPPRPGLGAHSLAINRYSTHAQEAYLVIQYLTSIQIGQEYIKRGGRPFRLSHFSKDAIKKFPYLKAIQKGMETGRCRPNIPEYPAVSHIFYTAFHSALQHGASISEVMRAAAQKANTEILEPQYPKGLSNE
ncbi:MAG: extracellular solute-binding protein [Fibrobacterales bacterium]